MKIAVLNKGKETIICINCKKEVTDWKCHHRKFCSRRCHRLYNNPMKNDDAKKKMSKIMQGRKITWNYKISKSRKLGFKNGTIKAFWNKDNSFRLLGENNPNWRGGISFEPYSSGWTEILKISIRNRDNNKCQICGNWGNTIHHIDYDKKNSNPDNLVCLCSGCHGKTNGNRDVWTKYFEELLCKRKS